MREVGSSWALMHGPWVTHLGKGVLPSGCYLDAKEWVSGGFSASTPSWDLGCQAWTLRVCEWSGPICPRCQLRLADKALWWSLSHKWWRLGRENEFLPSYPLVWSFPLLLPHTSRLHFYHQLGQKIKEEVVFLLTHCRFLGIVCDLQWVFCSHGRSAESILRKKC